MYALFKAKALESIPYIKMYSSFFPGEVAETSFAFILMPYSQQKLLVSLHSIEFVFNAGGEVTRMNIIYSGEDCDIQEKVKETIAELVMLKLSHERGDSLSIYNSERKHLEFSFVKLAETPAYLSDIIDCLKKLYLMSTDFVQEIKPQLLSPEYLAAEFAYLKGTIPESRPCCVLM